MPSEEAILEVLYGAYIFCLIYLVGVSVLYVILALAASVEAALRNRQSRAEDFETLATSRFTIPVSVIAPAYNEDVLIVASVRSLLAIEYPELEVIVVNDGSTDRTLDLLKREFDLEPRLVFFRRLLPSGQVRAIYRSKKEPRLVVVDKENGGKADALNCGINLSRYRYICCVDADTFYDRKALLKAMRLALKDPARVIAVTSPVAISSQPEARQRADWGEKAIDRKPFIDFQYMDYLRAFLNNRLAWSRYGFMLCVTGVFSIWRRDVVQELGGFSTRFTCEDVELTFRAHHHFRKARKPYQILSLPDVVGSTEGPTRLRSLIAQRSRWQRTILESIWAYRQMFLNPRYGSVGLVGMPYYVIYEGLAPLVEFVSVLVLAVAWWLDVIAWQEFVLFIGIVAFANGILTNVAVLLQDRTSRSYGVGSLAGLIFLGALEFLVYRPIIFVARWKGWIGFLRHDRAWHKFARNSRAGGRAAS